MYQTCLHNQEKVFEKKHTLSEFFDAHWDKYIKAPKRFIRDEEYKAVSAIRVCRTEKLGIEEYVCEDCGEVTHVHHSCKNRFCPTCSWTDTMKWAENLKYRMFDLKHRHIVMTLPHKLNSLTKRNEKEILNLFMPIAAEVFKDWMYNKYEIKPGIISVLHTFGEKKNYHVHVHMIVSWGGINKDGKLYEIKGEYADYKFLQKKFMIKFEDMLIKLFNNKKLKSNYTDKFQLLKFIKQINKKNWVLHLEPAMDIPTQVIRYIGRYSKRACLSEYKITENDGEYITFKYKDYKNKDIYDKPIEKELKLHYNDFFPRLLQHVPYKRFKIVRYYGHYAGASNIPNEYLYNPEQEYKEEIIQEQEINITTDDFRICKTCNKYKKYIHTIFKNKENKLVKIQEIRLLDNNDFRDKFVA